MRWQDADMGKIMALKDAGWGNEKIADEMHMEPDAVKEMISKYVEKRVCEAKDKGEEVENSETEQLSIILSYGQLQELNEKAAAVGAKEALKIYEKERKKEFSKRADRRLRNTKLLLRNYHMLKEHAENSVFGRTQMEESALDILESMMSIYDNEVIIDSIKRSATRTAVIVSHIETMFGFYEVYCDKSPKREIEVRRYETLWDMYMAEETLTVQEIAKKRNISKDTVYSDLKIATDSLSALIFGVDGLYVR
jgi:hypothetical protein